MEVEMEIIREEHFGTIERIREWKNETGITWEQFADLVGVSYKGVKRWTNKKAPTPIRSKNLAKIAEVMDCDVEYLECKQNFPKRSAGKIPLIPLSSVDRYLPKIRALMSSTASRFDYKYDPMLTGQGEEIEGSFIEGETRCYYTDTVFNNEVSDLYYLVSVNGSEPIRVSEARIEAFVRRIMRMVSREIEDLKEVKEMYPIVVKEMNRNNMTVEELAQAIGADPEELAGKLRGDRKLTFSEAVKVKAALGSELLLENLFET